MTTIEFLYLEVGIIAAIVGVICWHLADLDKMIDELKVNMLKHDKCFATVEEERVDDLCKLAALEQRVRVLEEKLDDHLEHSAIPEFPYPEDEEIIKYSS